MLVSIALVIILLYQLLINCKNFANMNYFGLNFSVDPLCLLKKNIFYLMIIIANKTFIVIV